MNKWTQINKKGKSQLIQLLKIIIKLNELITIKLNELKQN